MSDYISFCHSILLLNFVYLLKLSPSDMSQNNKKNLKQFCGTPVIVGFTYFQFLKVVLITGSAASCCIIFVPFVKPVIHWQCQIGTTFLALFCFVLCLTVNISKEMNNIDEESVFCVVLFKFLLFSLKETGIPKIYEVRHTLSFLSVAFCFFEHMTSENTKLTFINAFLCCSFLILHSPLWGFVWVISVLLYLYLQSCKLFNLCNISHQVSCTYAEFSVCLMSYMSIS